MIYDETEIHYVVSNASSPIAVFFACDLISRARLLIGGANEDYGSYCFVASFSYHMFHNWITFLRCKYWEKDMWCDNGILNQH